MHVEVTEQLHSIRKLGGWAAGGAGQGKGIGFVSLPPALQSFPFNGAFSYKARWINMLKIHTQTQRHVREAAFSDA